MHKIIDRFINVVINYFIVKQMLLLDLLSGFLQAKRDFLRCFRRSFRQPFFESLETRRRQEDENGLRAFLLDLPGTLHLDFEDYVTARAQLRLHPLLWCAVEGSGELRPFKQRAAVDQRLKLIAGAEEVI